MVEFSSYTTPMDREYSKTTVNEVDTNDVGIGVQDIGQSVPMGIAAQNVAGVGAKIRAGAGNLEIGFAGVGRGGRQGQTPGMYGKEQRRAFREMAEVNEVNLTTHAAYGIMGLAGIDQQGNFSKEQRKFAVDEIKRAIEFAADATQGGSVVVHTGEYQRPISEEAWAKDESGNYLFKSHEREEEEAVVRVVDNRTGQVMTQVRKNQDVAKPIWNRAKEGYDWEDTKTGETYTISKEDYIDYEGNLVSREERVPEFDESTGRFKVDTFGWDYFVGEADEINQINAEKVGMSIEEYRKKHFNTPDASGNTFVLPEEAQLRATLETNAHQAKGWALYYNDRFEASKKALPELRKALKFYGEIEKNTPEDEMWKLKQQAADRLGLGRFTPAEYKNTTELIKDADRKSTRLNSSHIPLSRMPSSA